MKKNLSKFWKRLKSGLKNLPMNLQIWIDPKNEWLWKKPEEIKPKKKKKLTKKKAQ